MEKQGFEKLNTPSNLSLREMAMDTYYNLLTRDAAAQNVDPLTILKSDFDFAREKYNDNKNEFNSTEITFDSEHGQLKFLPDLNLIYSPLKNGGTRLSKKQSKIMYMFMINPKNTYSAVEIGQVLQKPGTSDSDEDLHSVGRVQITNLRKKLGQDDKKRIIHNVYRVGYSLTNYYLL